VKDLKVAAIVRRRAPNRVAELDGLRGIAALWVVFYHLWGAIERREIDWVPSLVSEFLRAGWLGVDIFFMLSGFVITHSVANIRVTLTFIPKFILRRSVRIDPPYWAAIGLAIAFMML
jgi:peptidoglycan/LPS O-acetylase OafA/YrhL